MASVFKKRGKWYLRFRDHLGVWRKRVSEARTKTEASRLADDMERRCERQRLGLEPMPREAAHDTVGELLQWWLDAYPGATDSTHGKNLSTVRKHLLESSIAKIPAAQLTPGDVERLLHAKQSELGPQTLNHLRMFLHRAYSRAIEMERIEAENPIKRVRRRKVPKPPPDYLKTAEVPRLLAALSDDFRPLFATALYAGLRKGELFGLRKSEVDLGACLLTVAHSHARDVTKGGHVKAIPIAVELVPYLKLAMDRSPSELVFPGPDGARRREDTDLVAVLRRAMGRAGIVTGFVQICRRKGCGHRERTPDAALRRCPDCDAKLWPKPQVRPLRFNLLRHTTASLLLMAGANPASVQQIMRHSDPRITTGVYGHLSSDYLHAEVNRLRFNPPAPKMGSREPPTTPGAAPRAARTQMPELAAPVVPTEAPTQTPELAAPSIAVGVQEPNPFAPYMSPHPATPPSGTSETPAKNQQYQGSRMARPAGFEPATLGLEGLTEGRPGSGSASQGVGIVRVDAGGRVQDSQPVAHFSKDFVPVVSPRKQTSEGPASAPPARLEVIRGGAGNLLTVRQVAERLSVSTATVYKLCDRGELPHCRVGNSIRVAPEALRVLVGGAGPAKGQAPSRS